MKLLILYTVDNYNRKMASVLSVIVCFLIAKYFPVSACRNDNNKTETQSYSYDLKM